MHAPLASFYDDMLREIVAALGAALFFGNLVALMRRTDDSHRATEHAVASSRPGSPVRSPASAPARRELAQAPMARTVTYLVIGFVVMIAGIASLTA